MDNTVSQTEELLALQSIFDDRVLIIENNHPCRGRFFASVHLPNSFHITCLKGEVEISKFQVDYLPPIELIFEFPDIYPSHSCPAFLLTCQWLSLKRLSELCKKLEAIWQEGNGEVILFTWINYLQEEALSYLGIVNSLHIIISNELQTTVKCKKESFKNAQQLNGDIVDSANSYNCRLPSFNSRDENENLDARFYMNIRPSINGGNGVIDCRAVSDTRNGLLIISILKDYNKCKTQETFNKSIHTCQICLSDKKGYEFAKFSTCNHEFCKECMSSYFEIQIIEGNVHALNCPRKDCSLQADSSLVKILVDEHLFNKYDTLLLTRTLEGMSDITYCPRKDCQTPVILDSDSKMGHCSVCKFPFCIFCRMAYHGVAPCNLKTEEKKILCKKYLESGMEEKVQMERRYGKKEIRALVDDMLSEEWVNRNSKACPQCNCNIEKNDGCNKMTCYRCGNYFCWLCMDILQSRNPYTHYGNPASRCYNQLFPEDFDFAEPGEFLED